MRYIRRSVVVFLTLLIIATYSTNSAPSSLQGEATIPNYATISGRFEIELRRTNDVLSLDNEQDIDVLGTVQQTPRYGVSGEAWVDGVWTSSLFFDTTLSDRFFVKCTEEKAISMSSYLWVEWTAPVLEGDQELPPNDRTQDNFADTIFFEDGGESGVLQPPWDSVKADGDSFVRTVTSPQRSGDRAFEHYQPSPPKDDGERRCAMRKYQSSFSSSARTREFYVSWWVYFPDESPWNTLDSDSWSTTMGGWQLWFGPPDDRYRWWTGGRFHIQKSTREVMFFYSFHNYPVIDTRKDFVYSSGFYIDEHLGEWVHLQAHIRMASGDNSIVRAWVNNNLFAEKTSWGGAYYDARPEAYPEWTEYDCDWPSVAEPNGYPNITIELYDSTSSKEKRIFTDDVVWATEKVTESYEVGQ